MRTGVFLAVALLVVSGSAARAEGGLESARAVIDRGLAAYGKLDSYQAHLHR
jgi:anthranilate phosphoribosyltransferase